MAAESESQPPTSDLLPSDLLVRDPVPPDRVRQEGAAALAEFRARYATVGDAPEEPTGGLTWEQLQVLSALPRSTPEARDAWWSDLHAKLVAKRAR